MLSLSGLSASRQRVVVVMAAQKAHSDVLLHRLHYALPGWEAERRDAQGEFHSAAQARAWADGDAFDADDGSGLDGVHKRQKA
jgi:hypothetical protein